MIVLNTLVYVLLNRDIIQRIMGSEISLGMSLLACMLLEHKAVLSSFSPGKLITVLLSYPYDMFCK